VVVGVCQLELRLPGNRSLKGKRRVKRSIVDRAQSKFGLSLGEVRLLDRKNTLVLGAAYVSNDPVHARRVLQSFVDWVAGTGLAVLHQSHIEMLKPREMSSPFNWEGGDTND
jgi:hypothetical protein